MKPKTTLASTLAKAGGTTDWACEHCNKKYSLFELNASNFTCSCGSTDLGKVVCQDHPKNKERL